MVRPLKPAVFLLALIPFAYLLSKIILNDLGPDPAQTLSIETGEWTLRFLILTLAVSPAGQLFGLVHIG